MLQFERIIGALLIFIPSVWALTKFKKQSDLSQKVIFLSLALVIFIYKGVVPFLIFMAAFVPLLSLEMPINPIDEPKKSPTSVFEKFIVYFAMMPLFGLLILKRDTFEENLKSLSLPQDQLWITEVVMLIMIGLTLIGTLRLKKK